ncbi:MAG: hypothetical protein WAK82_18980 [Streptosporangiaceae bacterium]
MRETARVDSKGMGSGASPAPRLWMRWHVVDNQRNIPDDVGVDLAWITPQIPPDIAALLAGGSVVRLRSVVMAEGAGA